MPYRVVPCRAMPCRAVPCHAVLGDARSKSHFKFSPRHRIPLSRPCEIIFCFTLVSYKVKSPFHVSAFQTYGDSQTTIAVIPSTGSLVMKNIHSITRPYPLPIRLLKFLYIPNIHSPTTLAALADSIGPINPTLTAFSCAPAGIYTRLTWKYGERAFRYCNHDVGHAIAAVSMAAAGLGWDVKILDGLGHEDLEKLMGLNVFPKFEVPSKPIKGKIPDIEFEHPDCVLVVFPSGVGEFDVNYEKLSSSIEKFSALDWIGKPNSLSKEHVCWDIIYKSAEAVEKPLTISNEFKIDPFCASGICSESCYKDYSVREVVRKRRSAVDMDAKTTMERETFYQILLHCLPSGSGSGEKQKRPLALPFRVLSWDAEVHAVLFVHRVKGLPKGLYFLVRNEDHFEELENATRHDFEWEKPEGCPDDLPLYILARGDCQQVSKALSCHQDIAGDGCFSLGMVAHFGPTLRNKNAWMYPRLFWETGVLGQVLYLEAHAIGISATGIGCFFDDPVHELLGLRGSNFQSLYHFTVGGPVLDNRIMSLPAYPGPKIDA
ncbi:hypothetical protein EZV62_009671 [Acer yangbiense]|uniref:Nitroreductase domain-containing protein n=1 Tax=Acer yangbiense TaxID=1000413 RepID=A0A5C7I025_9ROSI|nr:hypothetical protein EZV62_009671 [Acer yangbiense]